MKALLVGSGAVGLGIGAALYDAGWDLDMVAKGKTKQTIEQGGFVRRGLFKQVFVPAGKTGIYERVQDIDHNAYDFILICTKTTISAEIAADLWNNKGILKAAGKIVLFQNGFGHDAPFLQLFAREQIYLARVITGFSRPEPNICEITVHAEPILIGSLYGNSLECVTPLAQAINTGGIPCDVTGEIDRALWAKMLYNCTLNPLGAILNVNYGQLTENDYSVSLMNQIIEEIFQVMTAAGYTTYWQDAKSYIETFYSKLIPATYNHRSSTLQDIERRIRTEIDSLTGVIVRFGEELDLPVPCNKMLYKMIKTKESFYLSAKAED